MKKGDGRRTLLWSVLLSAPGPIVVGLGLLAGRSSTQLADFLRRSAELLAIIAAYVVFLAANRAGTNEAKKARLERGSNRFVGAMMCLSGGAMLFLAAFGSHAEKGNVIPGLVIALLGVTANTIFWFRYARLSKESGNAILTVQSRLYRAKALVDLCVSLVLLAVALFPQAGFTGWLDLCGSLVVALYLLWCGLKTLRETK